MPVLERIKTKYPGVTFIVGKSVFDGRAERIYYIRYRKDGKEYEEKAGRQVQDDMTPAKAASMRALRIQGKEPSNQQKRDQQQTIKDAEKSKWTIERLWDEYKKLNPNLKGMVSDKNRFDNYLKPNMGTVEGGGKLRQLAARNCDTEFISDPLSIFLSIENLCFSASSSDWQRRRFFLPPGLAQTVALPVGLYDVTPVGQAV
jgi:hypothetical protein